MAGKLAVLRRRHNYKKLEAAIKVDDVRRRLLNIPTPTVLYAVRCPSCGCAFKFTAQEGGRIMYTHPTAHPSVTTCTGSGLSWEAAQIPFTEVKL